MSTCYPDVFMYFVSIMSKGSFHKTNTRCCYRKNERRKRRNKTLIGGREELERPSLRHRKVSKPSQASATGPRAQLNSTYCITKRSV